MPRRILGTAGFFTAHHVRGDQRLIKPFKNRRMPMAQALIGPFTRNQRIVCHLERHRVHDSKCTRPCKRPRMTRDGLGKRSGSKGGWAGFQQNLRGPRDAMRQNVIRRGRPRMGRQRRSQFRFFQPQLPVQSCGHGFWNHL